jgi:predicted metal-dependent hydrolase
LKKLIDNIIRSKRRTIALVITKDATLEVRAPLNVSFNLIEKFIAKKRSWIEKKKDLVNKNRIHTLPKEFVNGERFMCEGNTYKLQLTDCEDIYLSEVLHFPKKLLPQAKQYLTCWYKNRALKKVVERANYYTNITKLQYKTIKITNAKNSWGSCSSKGSLNINWKLIMAMPNVLDYVIVHELIHLVERNHSKLFWSKVRLIVPNYKEQEEWLKKNGNTLAL